MTRREVLLGGAALGAASLAPRLAEAESEPASGFRFVHMTDFHVQPELNAPQGMATALKHAMRKNPSLVMLGGDLVMDSYSATKDRTQKQWDVFTSVLKANCHVPVKYCIGNHDVWGWNRERSGTTGREMLWGKSWFLEVSNLNRTYYSFDAGHWKWIVLDTVQPSGAGYVGMVDTNQITWLADTLNDVPRDKPVIIVSHIPVFSPCPMVYGFDISADTYKVSSSQVTRNFNAVKRIFDQHPNVKLCVSGHIHLVDNYEYNGVNYLCNGAVCGAWWLGKHKDFEPGYVVIDLYRDGSFKHQFVKWGWRPA